ncbi:superinfection immunity protein [Streptomyces sp. NBRC 109706]|uniref:superinfection immunity protein n=1 Tax=Streptomyces sp. NBRC 109706 TaxID=1550035 RepID=UPI001F46359B|nr:superinfection immunity protein [Streptomyces sp. NBRC 109706]
MLYFVPTIIAFARGVRNAGSVLVVNLFLGWTLVGWVVALAMAARSTDRGSPYPR